MLMMFLDNVWWTTYLFFTFLDFILLFFHLMFLCEYIKENQDKFSDKEKHCSFIKKLTNQPPYLVCSGYLFRS